MMLKLDNVFPDIPEQFHERVLSTLDSQINKTHKTERVRIMKVKSIIAATIAFVMLGGVLTAGALTDWKFSELIDRIFSNNETVFDNLKNDVDFEVIKNTFEGVDFEISALYAGEDTMFVALDIKSKKSIFGKSDLINSYSISAGNMLFSTMTSESHITDKKRATMLYTFNNPIKPITNDDDFMIPKKISVGDEFTIPITEIAGITGEAEIRFTIGELTLGNTVTVYPDVVIASGNTITELSMNPFGINFCYNGCEYVRLGETDVQLKMTGGEIKDTLGLFGASGGSMGDDETRYEFKFNLDNTFNIDDVEAIIYEGIEIPLR